MQDELQGQIVQSFFQSELMTHIYSPSEILVNLSAAFILSMVIAYTYRGTHRGLSYSQGFVLTLILVAVITSMVIMVIGNNLARAFALVGALSIIRFRTVVKDTKDIAYVFFALASGLAAGTSNYFIAVAGSLFLCGIAIVLNGVNFGSLYKSEFILRFQTASNNSEAYSATIEQYAKSSELIHVQRSGDHQSNQLTLDVVMKKDVDPTALIEALDKVDGISNILLIASAKDADY